MKSKILAAALLFLAFAACAAWADEGEETVSPFRLSGREYDDLYWPTKDHDDHTFQQANTSIWLQGDGTLTPSLSARAIYQGDLFWNARLTGDRPATHLRNRLREGYAQYFGVGLDLRAGKMIIPWGKSDGINPTDYLSAKESNFLNHDSEVTRVGGTGILASLTPNAGDSKVNLTLVVQPWFPESVYLIPPAAVPAGVTIKDVQTPGRSLENTEFAGKVAYTGEGWDASLSYFHGFDHRPVFSEISHQAVSPTFALVNVNRVFVRENAVGGDASYSQGAWIYRLESAWHATSNDANPLLTPSHWDTVLGVERPILEKFRVQGQFVSRLFPHWSDPATATGADAVATAINREIAAANALLQQYQHKWNSATTLRASYTLEDPSFTAELLWYQGLNDGDYYLRPMLSYGLYDSLRMYLGYDHYGGPTDKSIGSLQSYNAVFTELKATF